MLLHRAATFAGVENCYLDLKALLRKISSQHAKLISRAAVVERIDDMQYAEHMKQKDKEKGRQGDKEIRALCLSPCLRVSLSPCLLRGEILRLKRRNKRQVAKSVLIIQAL